MHGMGCRLRPQSMLLGQGDARDPTSPARKSLGVKGQTSTWGHLCWTSTSPRDTSITHRVTSEVVAVATTNARYLRESLLSLCDEMACKVIAKLIAQRSMEVMCTP